MTLARENGLRGAGRLLAMGASLCVVSGCARQPAGAEHVHGSEPLPSEFAAPEPTSPPPRPASPAAPEPQADVVAEEDREPDARAVAEGWGLGFADESAPEEVG